MSHMLNYALVLAHRRDPVSRTIRIVFGDRTGWRLSRNCSECGEDQFDRLCGEELWNALLSVFPLVASSVQFVLLEQWFRFGLGYDSGDHYSTLVLAEVRTRQLVGTYLDLCRAREVERAHAVSEVLMNELLTKLPIFCEQMMRTYPESAYPEIFAQHECYSRLSFRSFDCPQEDNPVELRDRNFSWRKQHLACLALEASGRGLESVSAIAPNVSATEDTFPLERGPPVRRRKFRASRDVDLPCRSARTAPSSSASVSTPAPTRPRARIARWRGCCAARSMVGQRCSSEWTLLIFPALCTPSCVMRSPIPSRPSSSIRRP